MVPLGSCGVVNSGPEPWGACLYPAPPSWTLPSSHSATSSQKPTLTSCPSTASVLRTHTPGRQLLSPAVPVHPWVPLRMRAPSPCLLPPPMGAVQAWAAPQQAQEEGQAATCIPTPVGESQDGGAQGPAVTLPLRPKVYLRAGRSLQGSQTHIPLPTALSQRARREGPSRPGPCAHVWVRRRCTESTEGFPVRCRTARGLKEAPRARTPQHLEFPGLYEPRRGIAGPAIRTATAQ